MAGVWLTMRGSHPKIPMTLWSFGLSRSRNKLKHLHHHDVYGHRPWHDGEWLLPIKPRDHKISWSCKITWQTKKIIYPYGYRTWQGGDIHWRTSIHKVTSPFGHVFLQGHVKIRSVISSTTMPIVTKLGEKVAYYKGLPHIKSDNPLCRPHGKSKPFYLHNHKAWSYQG